MSVNGSRAATLPLIAGAACLDLVNSVSWRGDATRRVDHLGCAEDALTWATRAGIVTAVEADALRDRVNGRPELDAALVDELIVLREHIAADAAADPPALLACEPEIVDAITHSSLTAAPGGRRWRVREIDEHLLSHRLALDAYQLFAEPHKRIGDCGDPACGWVFLDTSRQQNRRWCDSADCGNRYRVRQFNQRMNASNS